MSEANNGHAGEANGYAESAMATIEQLTTESVGANRQELSETLLSATQSWTTYERTRLSEEARGAALTRALLSTANPGEA